MPAQARGVQRVIVTRPEPDAARWVQALRERGWEAEAWPLLRIAEPHDAAQREQLVHWRQAWPTQDALMFVSAAAVLRFFADAVAPGPGHARFWAPGPGTARALSEALWALGIGDEHIDTPPRDAAQFDSEHLWPVVASQMAPGRRLLVVRGASDAGGDGSLPGQGREWLIERCRAAGAEVQACVAYQRERVVPEGAALDRLQAFSGEGQVWLLSSSEALQSLQGRWPAGARAVALATHPRIAEAARALGFADVITARAALADVVRTLESWAGSPP
ncbi:MAG: uroporphyrinogen-III synthase [Hydrogenophaga sp.]|nr:uroporphyrinogen-III synthase [Hydrogenophaga sp.]